MGKELAVNECKNFIISASSAERKQGEENKKNLLFAAWQQAEEWKWGKGLTYFVKDPTQTVLLL